MTSWPEFWLLAALAVAGGIGAASRYLVTATLAKYSKYPWGTFVANLSGSFLLGFLVGAAAHAPWLQVATVGFCGGYTTFSAASLNTFALWKEGKAGQAVFSGVGQLLAAVLLVTLGIVVGQIVVG